MDDYLFPLLLVLLASLFQGTFGLGMKYVKPLAWEAWWLVHATVAMLLFPWMWAFIVVPDLGSVLAHAPGRARSRCIVWFPLGHRRHYVWRQCSLCRNVPHVRDCDGAGRFDGFVDPSAGNRGPRQQPGPTVHSWRHAGALDRSGDRRICRHQAGRHPGGRGQRDPRYPERLGLPNRPGHCCDMRSAVRTAERWVQCHRVDRYGGGGGRCRHPQHCPGTLGRGLGRGVCHERRLCIDPPGQEQVVCYVQRRRRLCRLQMGRHRRPAVVRRTGRLRPRRGPDGRSRTGHRLADASGAGLDYQQRAWNVDRRMERGTRTAEDHARRNRRGDLRHLCAGLLEQPLTKTMTCQDSAGRTR